MNGKKILSLTLLLFAVDSLHAQQSTSVELLPDRLIFAPLGANLAEPRTGVRKQVGSSRMKLDIGSVLDIVEWRFGDTGPRLSVGSDFFMYALTTSSQGLRLQVDAVDGYFGGHVAIRTAPGPNALALRLRMLHLSAHFLDGHFDNSTGTWKNGRAPIPFTKDFGELTASWSTRLAGGTFMVYSGGAYATLIRPVEISRLSSQHGVEYHTSSLTGHVLQKPLTFYAAYNLTVTRIRAVFGTNHAECGVKFGEWDRSGVRLYGEYYAGLELFSEYYNVRAKYWGIGFAVDVW